MNILAIDSSNVVMGVGVSTDGQVLGELITNVKKKHSVRLMPAIEKLMNDVGMMPAEIDRIVVAKGPGSYTGVRIAVTVAKTLAWTLNKELVGVSSLELLAQNGGFFEGLIVPFFDARRGQAFTGLYRKNSDGIQTVIEDKLTLMEDWVKYLKKYDEPILFLSQDMVKHRETIVNSLASQAVIGGAEIALPRPSLLAKLGAEREPVTDIHAFVPSYLRLAEAEANWLKAQKGSDLI